MGLKWLPNALTVLRCVLAIVAAGAAATAGAQGLSPLGFGTTFAPSPFFDASVEGPAFFAGAMLSAQVAFTAFALAALTDLLDGIAARALAAESAFGAWLDPIADKLLVGLMLVALTLFARPVWVIAVPAVAILVRDTWVTILRARRGGGHALPVMRLSKWKTALELAGLLMLLGWMPLFWAASGHGALLSEPSFLLLDASEHLVDIGLASLWLAAALSLYTGWRYLQADRDHAPSVPDVFD